MKYQLEWKNEEEGRITFFDRNNVLLTVDVFVTGEEEAELRLQDVVVDINNEKNSELCTKIIQKVTECVSECFRLLWEEGYDEVVLVEQKGTKLAKILDSTDVVQIAYKEYMMKQQIELQKSTSCGDVLLKLTDTENGIACENAEKTFFCRLLPYEEGASGEQKYYLYEVEVKKAERNKGVATACLTELFRQLGKEGPVTIFLQVGSYNEPAVHLYQKLGFEFSEELCYYAMVEEM